MFSIVLTLYQKTINNIIIISIIDNMATTIAVTETMRDRLKTYGIKGETYNQILERILNLIERKTYLAEVYKRLGEKSEFVSLDRLE